MSPQLSGVPDPRAAHTSPDPDQAGPTEPRGAALARAGMHFCNQDCVYQTRSKGFLSSRRATLSQPRAIIYTCRPQGPLREQIGDPPRWGPALFPAAPAWPGADLPDRPHTLEADRSQPGAGPALPRPVMGSWPPQLSAPPTKMVSIQHPFPDPTIPQCENHK